MAVSPEVVALIDDFDAGMEPFGKFSAQDSTGEACPDNEKIWTQGADK